MLNSLEHFRVARAQSAQRLRYGPHVPKIVDFPDRGARFCFKRPDGKGLDSSVGIATCYGLGVSEDRIPVEAKFSALVQTGPGAQPSSCTMGTGFPSRE